jgi:outer membrane scaffolding protein for murein synthesis (MipA/OmpV family)
MLSTATPEQHNDEQVRITVGAGLINSTRYIGSNERRYRAMPTFNAQWKNGWFAGFPRGVGYNFSDRPHMEYGLRLTADMGRKQNASAALNGLGNISPRAELGAFYNFPLSRQIKIDTALRYGAGQDSKGMLLDLGMNYRVPYNDAQSFLFGIKTSYANRNYMQSYFGVDATQSVDSGYAQYTPGAGIREVDLTAGHMYKLDKQWMVMTGLTYGRLGSVAKGAPMTRSNAHNSVYIQANYTF